MKEEGSDLLKNRKAILFKTAAQIAIKQGHLLLANKNNKKLNVLMDQASLLVESVGKLKGAAMKAVQTLSVEGYDFFPEEVLAVLSQLQSQSKPVDSERMHKIIRQELGEEKWDKLKDLGSTPIAAASIGQVYKAKIEERKVVIKVQYPGIAESVDSDMDTLQKLINGLIFITNKKVDASGVMNELREVIKGEVDYLKEAENLKKYNKLITSTNYLVPKVIDEFSTQRILTLEYIEGEELESWSKMPHSYLIKKEVAQKLIDLYMIEFFENNLVQTDPNPANFLVNDKNQLVLLDFGATKSFDSEFVENYKMLVRSVFKGDDKEIKSQIDKMKLIDPREDLSVQDLFLKFLKQSLYPFRDELQPFDFSDDEYSKSIRALAFEFSKKLKYSPPPKDLLFLHRKLGGIFMIVKKLGVKLDLKPFRDLILMTN